LLPALCVDGVLVGPYFKVKYADKWGSIESTFISERDSWRPTGPSAVAATVVHGTRFD